MEEQWKQFPNHPRYSVSNTGRVMNDETGIERKATVDHYGYLRVNMYENGEIVTHYIHRLVAELYLDDYRPKIMITFKNDNRADCRVENLEVRETARMIQKRLGVIPRVHAKRVYIVELDKLFRNAYDAARYIKGDVQAIYRCLRHERLTHKGYTFTYQNTEQSLAHLRRKDKT